VPAAMGASERIALEIVGATVRVNPEWGRRLDATRTELYNTAVHVGGRVMTVQVSYSQARQELASLLDDVTSDREVVIINRRNGEPAALIAADELVSLTETAHLLRSPANASRLLEALARALKGRGQPMTVAQLRAEVGLEKKDT